MDKILFMNQDFRTTSLPSTEIWFNDCSWQSNCYFYCEILIHKDVIYSHLHDRVYSTHKKVIVVMARGLFSNWSNLYFCTLIGLWQATCSKECWDCYFPLVFVFMPDSEMLTAEVLSDLSDDKISSIETTSHQLKVITADSFLEKYGQSESVA